MLIGAFMLLPCSALGLSEYKSTRHSSPARSLLDLPDPGKLELCEESYTYLQAITASLHWRCSDDHRIR